MNKSLAWIFILLAGTAVCAYVVIKSAAKNCSDEELKSAIRSGAVDKVRDCLVMRPGKDRLLQDGTPLVCYAILEMNESSSGILDLLCTDGRDPNVSDALGRNPLHYLAVAESSGKIDNGAWIFSATYILFEHGIDYNHRDRNGDTPLVLAKKLRANVVVNALETYIAEQPDSDDWSRPGHSPSQKP